MSVPLRDRLGDLIPNRIKRDRAERDAAFLEAAREAYRAAARDAAQYFDAPARVADRAAGSPSAPSMTPEDAPSVAGARSPEVDHPATPPWSRAAARPGQRDSQPLSVLPQASLPAGGARAQTLTPHVGEAPLDHLLQVPESVDVAADGFFGGLARRVEGDR
jgi:hypothetical protein